MFYSNGHEREISLKHYSKTMEIFLMPVAEILQLICILWLNHLLQRQVEQMEAKENTK